MRKRSLAAALVVGDGHGENQLVFNVAIHVVLQVCMVLYVGTAFQ